MTSDAGDPPVIKEEGVKVVVYTGYGDGSLNRRCSSNRKPLGITIIYRDINPTPENSRRASRPERILLSPPALTKAARRQPPSGPSPSSR